MILHQLPGRPATPELVLPSQVYAWYRLLRSVSPTSQPPASPLLGHAKPLRAGTEDPPVTDAVRGVGRGAVTALTFCWPPKGHKPNQATLVTLLIKFLSPWGCQKKYQVFAPCNGERNHRPKEPWNDAGARGREGLLFILNIDSGWSSTVLLSQMFASRLCQGPGSLLSPLVLSTDSKRS